MANVDQMQAIVSHKVASVTGYVVPLRASVRRAGP
jgi:hypothetical protein